MDQQEWFSDFGKVSARFGHTVASKAIKQDEDIQSQQWEGFAVKKVCKCSKYLGSIVYEYFYVL